MSRTMIRIMFAGTFVLALVSAPNAHADNEPMIPGEITASMERCMSVTGFNHMQECGPQTSGLGECKMCCTAIQNCKIWNTSSPFEISLALSEANACRGLCLGDA